MMFMTPQTALMIGIIAPLVTAVLTPFLGVRANWRDVAGPIGAVITFVAALHVAGDVMQGEALNGCWQRLHLALISASG